MRDRLILARFLLLAAIVFSAVGIGLVTLVISIPERSATRQGAALTRVLNLSGPALVPSGRNLRHPEAIEVGVNRRFSPQLPILEPGTETIFLRVPTPERRP
jgi:hypothetical protein